MAKILIIGAGAMGTAFAYPCVDNKHDVSIVGTHLENKAIEELNKNRFHPGLNLEVIKSIKFFKHESIKEVFKTKSDLIVIPGGFSYGDYLRSGAIAAKSNILKEVVKASQKGCLILGVCNGFQILIETGLLKGALLRNQNLRFLSKDVKAYNGWNVNSIICRGDDPSGHWENHPRPQGEYIPKKSDSFKVTTEDALLKNN